MPSDGAMNVRKPLTYRAAGVDIDAGETLVDRIRPLAARTRRPEVLAGLGGFSALFELPVERYRHPVLVSGTDGVGTKLRLALSLQRHEGLGVDLVAMCVNDVLLQASGAQLEERLAGDPEGRPLAEVLLAPTRIYASSVLAVLRQPELRRAVKGLAHITGGGLIENIARIVPAGLTAVVGLASWQMPAVFEWLRREEPIARRTSSIARSTVVWAWSSLWPASTWMRWRMRCAPRVRGYGSSATSSRGGSRRVRLRE